MTWTTHGPSPIHNDGAGQASSRARLHPDVLAQVRQNPGTAQPFNWSVFIKDELEKSGHTTTLEEARAAAEAAAGDLMLARGIEALTACERALVEAAKQRAARII